MKLLDLTPAQLERADTAGHLEVLEREHPVLHAHYRRYWSPEQVTDAGIEREVLRARAALVRDHVPRVERAFHAAGIDTSGAGVVLFIGCHWANGHAFVHEGRGWAWISVERFQTELCTDVFLTHELAHAVHYAAQPAFYFADDAERTHVGRQVVTEGLATFASQRLIGVSEPVALWADYVSEDLVATWMRECTRRRDELAQFVVDHWHESSEENGLFTVGDPFEDVFTNRGGYYIGRQVIEELSAPLADLFDRPRSELESQVLALLAR